MLRKNKNIPLDYSLCTMDVTVYRRESLTRHVLHGVHLESEGALTQPGPMARLQRKFLLVIPGAFPIAPGDKVLPGIGPEMWQWEDLDGGTVQSVKQRFFMGTPCHVEARG